MDLQQVTYKMNQNRILPIYSQNYVKLVLNWFYFVV